MYARTYTGIIEKSFTSIKSLRYDLKLKKLYFLREPEEEDTNSSSIGINLNESFPDKAINRKCPTLVAVHCPFVGGQMGKRVTKWINCDLRLIKLHDWDSLLQSACTGRSLSFFVWLIRITLCTTISQFVSPDKQQEDHLPTVSSWLCTDTSLNSV